MAHRVSGESAIARPSPRRTAWEPSVPRRYTAIVAPPPCPLSVKSTNRPSCERSATHDASSHDRSRSATSSGRRAITTARSSVCAITRRPSGEASHSVALPGIRVIVRRVPPGVTAHSARNSCCSSAAVYQISSPFQARP